MSVKLGHMWFNGLTDIGIVLTYDAITDKCKAWIGNSQGFSEEADTTHIARIGTKFPIQEAASLIQKYGTITGHQLIEDYASLMDFVKQKGGEF